MTRNRIARVRDEMQKHGLDAMLVSSLSNIRYLTGFTGSNGLLVISSRSAFFFSDIRYTDQAKLEVADCKVIITKIGLYEEAARRKLLDNSSKVGFESQQITYAQYRMLRKLFPSTSFASTKEVVEEVMLVKDEHEIALIKRAAEISDQVFNEVLEKIRPGVSELEIAGSISYLHRKLGAERDAFETIVASGERSAFPHARASQKKIKSGELVTLDFGCVVGGYNSDITRTVAVGRTSLKAKRMYDVVLEAQLAAEQSAKAGIWARDLDAIARQKIERRGMGKYFNHSLGHGLGLHIHERPRVSELSKERLRAGSVITIEPGVYIPGFGGVRIEDDVLLTKNGCVILNTASKEFLVL